MTKYYGIIYMTLMALYYAARHFFGGSKMDVWGFMISCLGVIIALAVNMIQSVKATKLLESKIDNLKTDVVKKEHSGLSHGHEGLNKEHERLNREHERLGADHKDLERRSEGLKELLIVLSTKFETKTFDASSGQALISALTSFVKTIDERVLELKKENQFLKNENHRLNEQLQAKEQSKQQENTLQHKDDMQKKERQGFEPEL